jgi:hypothetical protein
LIPKRETWRDWSGTDWFLVLVSESAFFGFFYVIQIIFEAQGNIFTGAITLWLLANTAILACPLIRDHFL